MIRTVGGLLAVLLLLASTMSAARAEKRVALVIGNTEYAHVTNLRNPANDAKDLTAALQRIGFVVKTALNLGYSDTRRAGAGQSALPIDMPAQAVRRPADGKPAILVEEGRPVFRRPADRVQQRIEPAAAIRKHLSCSRRIRHHVTIRIGVTGRTFFKP